MGDESAIEWTTNTFNPWIGCTKVSPGCDNCYAETLAGRYGWAAWGAHQPRRRTSAAYWRQPLSWERRAAKAGQRERVFCASLADVFDAEVNPSWRDDLWALIRETPHLDWQLLTKRPNLIRRYLPDDWGNGWPNVWLMTSVESQAVTWRICHLLNVPAAVRGLSAEPLLGPIDLSPWLSGIAWVIVGGESGPRARPMHADWARSLRDQCQSAGVPFFFKQWGGRRPKDGGRLLDGREWNEYPA